jgi:hypothetical protein
MSDRAVITAIQKMAGTFREDKVRIEVGTVKSIEGNTCTCYVSDDMLLPNIQLQASVCDGWLLVPAVGSTVIVLYSTQNDPFIALYSDIDSAYLQVGDSSIEILNDGSITLNDGSFNGLVKVADLVTKLNNLENLVNDLVSKFNSHTHILTLTSGTGTAAPTAAPETTTLTPTQQSDLENKLITHGK